MLAISLTTILEQAAAEAKGTKNLSGNIGDFAELMHPSNLLRLETSYDAFSFLAFHPGVDMALRTYVQEGTLGSDSGPKMLALFSLADQATWPKVVSEQSFGPWLEIDAYVHPAYEMVQWLFEPRPAPPLPGIVLFESLIGEHAVVYVPLAAAGDAAAVRTQLRRVFALARAAQQKGTFADRLGAALQRERIEHVKSARRSPSELLIRSAQAVGDRVSDIVAVAGLAGL